MKHFIIAPTCCVRVNYYVITEKILSFHYDSVRLILINSFAFEIPFRNNHADKGETKYYISNATSLVNMTGMTTPISVPAWRANPYLWQTSKAFDDQH